MEGAAAIPLRRRDGSVRALALVNVEDLPLVEHYRWHLSGGYARSRDGAARPIYLHRVVAGLPPGDAREVDHRNRNPLDCTRENLRVCEHAENQQNRSRAGNGRSGRRGVSWHKTRRKWVARAKIAGRVHQVGYFDSPDVAAEAVSRFRQQHMPFAVEA